MKRVVILFLLAFLTPFFAFTQTQDTFEKISPFYEGLSAIKKGNQWAFINTKGAIIIGFRDDLVTTKTNDGVYPVFRNNRCLIVKEKEHISYFGYIDTVGKTVIEPTFLNAENFQNNVAIVLELKKEIAGYNNVIGKSIVYRTYSEVIINKKGEMIENLTAPKNIVLERKFLLKPPKITSKLLSEQLVAVLNKNKRWMLKRITN
ncbi:WG repeat-containing protein [uncultured Polaribacter sp.]|uniref:WG repeat-containing protein n=1 Tax=uncultured Polaribacter sp. TaxID=174711 RepID=UPI00261B0D77|nr:WG repeat-containing protein [uncultured Polaribacter sp.]